MTRVALRRDSTMNGSGMSWEALARALGERMANHAFCGDHAIEIEDPQECPFCHDRAVFNLYAAKVARPSDPLDSLSRVRIRQP